MSGGTKTDALARELLDELNEHFEADAAEGYPYGKPSVDDVADVLADKWRRNWTENLHSSITNLLWMRDPDLYQAFLRATQEG